jgi:NitT/TauT family transport system substrate-binding protein
MSTSIRLVSAALGALFVIPFVAFSQTTNPVPPSVPLTADAPFTVAVSTTTIEGGPVYVADEGPSGAGFRVINGGVRNLANSSAHAATNAETQLLLAGAPNVRILMTLAEGLYRIVARRSSGIRTLADLQGKKVTAPRDTSAHYFLVRMLATAGLAESDVTIVDLPRDRMAAGVASGQADAIAMWEPEAQNAVEALGPDAVIFQGNEVYRELFSLYTTTGVLNDPRRRKELVAFVRALLSAVDEVKASPAAYFPLIAKTIGQPMDRVARSWAHHRFPAASVSDMLDVMVEEEKWVAAKQGRAPRLRTELALFFDTTVLGEARQR